MEGKRFLICIVLLLLLTIVPGCATSPENRAYNSYDYNREEETAYSSQPVSPVLRFDDVPVPVGFDILDRESFAFQNDMTRVALLKYIGSGNADIVVQFFKDQMVSYNWNPINMIEYERRILNYEKETESCIVTIESKGRKSVITIAISPKSKPMKVKAKAE